MSRESRWWCPRSARRYTTKRRSLLIRVISATTSNGTVTFVRNNKCLRTSLPIVGEGGNTTGSPKQNGVGNVNILVVHHEQEGPAGHAPTARGCQGEVRS